MKLFEILESIGEYKPSKSLRVYEKLLESIRRYVKLLDIPEGMRDHQRVLESVRDY